MRSLLYIPVLLLSLAPHDFFISILTIAHRPQEEQLHLTWRMTTHDVEHALEPLVGGRKLHLGGDLELPDADSLLRTYVLGHLRLEVDGTPVRIEFVGREVEMDDMYCYLLVEGVKDPASITLHNTLLFDMFDEQENVVHLETAAGTRTHAFRNNSPAHTFLLDK